MERKNGKATTSKYSLLQTWTDEGVMFDLQKDCDWTDWYAWAPSIIECKYIKGKLARTPKEMRKNGKLQLQTNSLKTKQPPVSLLKIYFFIIAIYP